eukprot:402948-Prymnesium_polylepis.1
MTKFFFGDVPTTNGSNIPSTSGATRRSSRAHCTASVRQHARQPDASSFVAEGGAVVTSTNLPALKRNSGTCSAREP